MKTTTVKIDNSIINLAMRSGKFKRPEDAVSYALKIVFEAPNSETVHRKKHSAFVEKMRGVMKTDADYKDLIADVRGEKYKESVYQKDV